MSNQTLEDTQTQNNIFQFQIAYVMQNTFEANVNNTVKARFGDDTMKFIKKAYDVKTDNVISVVMFCEHQ